MADALKSPMEAAPCHKPSTRKSRRSHKPQHEPRGPVVSEMFLSLQHVPECQGIVGTPISASSQRSEHEDSLASRRNRSSLRASTNNRATPPSEMNQPAAGGDLFLRENTSIARQQLTSSASRVRPSKQQQAAIATRRAVPECQQDTSKARSNNNNNEDDDEPIVEEETARYNARSHILATREAMHWSTGLVSDRTSRYIGVSPSQGEDESTAFASSHSNRPPSRQCHAFPTDLLVPREFFSPAKHSDAAVNIIPWHNDEEDPTLSARPEDDSTEPQLKTPASHHRTRPPSRYMTKPSRGGASSASSSSSTSPGEGKRLPSRRGVAGSFNQATAQHHHDPKTDGFADVDESVPPPFRIEISTDSSQSQYIPSDHRRVDEERRHSLKSRRSSSFGTRAQLKEQEQRALRHKAYAVVDDDEVPRESKRPSKSRHHKKSIQQPQWLGGDQDPSYEASASKQSTRPAAASRKGSSTDNNTVTKGIQRSVAAATSTVAPQWFRATNNPFFESASTAAGYEDMDPETAIANTPLFAGEDDLMAMTQLSDLCLDDFVMGDPSAAAIPSNVTNAAAIQSSNNAPPPAASLNTSLGKDFLSLFAQH